MSNQPLTSDSITTTRHEVNITDKHNHQYRLDPWKDITSTPDKYPDPLPTQFLLSPPTFGVQVRILSTTRVLLSSWLPYNCRVSALHQLGLFRPHSVLTRIYQLHGNHWFYKSALYLCKLPLLCSLK